MLPIFHPTCKPARLIYLDRGECPEFDPKRDLPTNIIGDSIQLAEKILRGAELTEEEARVEAELAGMTEDPKGQALLTALTDQAFRPKSNKEVAELMGTLLEKGGIPEFFSPQDQTKLKLFKWLTKLSPRLAGLVVPMVIAEMRQKTRRVILPGEPEELEAYLQECVKEGVEVNANKLGDFVLGEKGAAKNRESNIKTLQNPKINAISVKISTLYSQLSEWAHDHSVEKVLESVKPILRAAIANKRADGKGVNGYKLVNFDMEEYKDLGITVEVFRQLMKDPEFKDLQLGIALQAYIPDSFEVQKELTQLAQWRVERGGAPIRIRIVKGANKEMEEQKGSEEGWESPLYKKKVEGTDANFKRMVEQATQPESINAVHVGIASHNIFDIAFAVTLGQARLGDDFEKVCTIEMLEGMANHFRREIIKICKKVLAYTPVAKRNEFLNAIAYLVRRFDENTAPDNFLGKSFGLKVGSEEWRKATLDFIRSVEGMATVSHTRMRVQNRLTKDPQPEPIGGLATFENEPNTDPSLPENQAWIDEIQTAVEPQNVKVKPYKLPRINDIRALRTNHLEEVTSFDKSRKSLAIGKTQMADEGYIKASLKLAHDDPSGWAQTSFEKRWEVLKDIPVELKKARGRLIAMGMMDVAKSMDQMDAEVSEAIDFSQYYPRALYDFMQKFPNIKIKPKGVTVVIPPWNFATAIPIGGIIASLMTGNRVIVKPSPLSLVATRTVVECLWEAGVPKDVLQFVPCQDGEAHHFTESEQADSVNFTGGTATCKRILKSNPGLNLVAETGGKNVMIITEKADRELAIKHITEALKYNAQKCSASCLVILTPGVYHDTEFMEQLKDAVSSLNIGSALEPQNTITPLIRKPNAALRKGLRLGRGERWLLKPQRINDQLYSPGIAIGVKPGSHKHLVELFGPVLGIMKARNVKHACKLANASGYGLTGGIHSLDERELRIARQNLKVGNLYEERGTQGAIVGRQPFGGTGKSRFGVGSQAGNFDYWMQFVDFEENKLPDVAEDQFKLHTTSALWPVLSDWYTEVCMGDENPLAEKLLQTANSYLKQNDHFNRVHRPAQKVIGQDNRTEYQAIGESVLRVSKNDTPFDVCARVMAAIVAGNPLLVSVPPELITSAAIGSLEESGLLKLEGVQVKLKVQKQKRFLRTLKKGKFQRLHYQYDRTKKDAEAEAIMQASAENWLWVNTRKPLMEGRVELIAQYEQKTTSENTHRYGNLYREQLKKVA